MWSPEYFELWRKVSTHRRNANFSKNFACRKRKLTRLGGRRKNTDFESSQPIELQD